MLHKDTDKLEGYEYPRPSIERGQSPTPKESPAIPLSRENAERLKQAINQPRDPRKP